MDPFARLASAGERKTMALVEKSISDLTDLRQGPIDLPCHIVAETHHGIWVKGTTQSALGVFRCQGHFWAIPIPAELIDGQQSAAVNTSDLIGDAIRQGLTGVHDLGPMDAGTESLAVGLTGILSGLEQTVTIPDSGGQFGAYVRAAAEFLEGAQVPLEFRYGAVATGSLPAERTAIEAEGLAIFELFAREDEWWMRDDGMPEGYNTGMPAGPPAYLAVAVAMQIVVSWIGLVRRGSHQYSQLEIRDRYIEPIVRFSYAMSETARDVGDDLLERMSFDLIQLVGVYRSDLQL